jgi:predicted amidohydrolase YtcJ
MCGLVAPMTTSEILLRNAAVIGIGIADVLITGGSISSIHGPGSTEHRAAVVVDCDGAALLPGLHDHHCHMLAAAAAELSIQCGPPADADELRRKLRSAVPGADGWVRVGFQNSVSGLSAYAALRYSLMRPPRIG